jgi:hypothetical protein
MDVPADLDSLSAEFADSVIGPGTASSLSRLRSSQQVAMSPQRSTTHVSIPSPARRTMYVTPGMSRSFSSTSCSCLCFLLLSPAFLSSAPTSPGAAATSVVAAATATSTAAVAVVVVDEWKWPCLCLVVCHHLQSEGRRTDAKRCIARRRHANAAGGSSGRRARRRR